MIEPDRSLEAKVLLDLLPTVSRQIGRELANTLRPLRVTPAQLQVLQLLIVEGDLPPRKISAALSLDQSTIVSTLTRLERVGYVTKLADPDDGRSRLMQATEKAKKVHQEARATVQETVVKAVSPLNSAELGCLHNLLARIVKKTGP